MDELQALLDKIKADQFVWTMFKNCLTVICLVDKNYCYLAQFESLRLLSDGFYKSCYGRDPQSISAASELICDIVDYTKRSHYDPDFKSNPAHIDNMANLIPELQDVKEWQEYKNECREAGTKIVEARYGLKS